ncbi:MAG: diguanylate cyclase [Clostridia bacterium]|nr:diguanylate cyclase [Clostridia bacterium]
MNKEDVKFILEKNARLIYFDRSSSLEDLEKIKAYMHWFSQGYESFRLAIISSVIKDLTTSIHYADEALNSAYANNDVYLIQEVAMFKGVILRSIGSHDEALMNYISTLKYGENPRAYNNIADIYLMIGDYEEAKVFLKRAMDALSQHKELSTINERLLNIVYTNMSEAELKSNNIEAGIESAKKCIEMAVGLREVYTEAFGYALLGTAYLMLEDYEVAISHFDHSMRLYDSCDPLQQNRVFDYIEDNIFQIAKCYYQWGKYEDALIYLDKLMNKGEDQRELEIQIYEALENEEKINEAYRSYFKYSRQINAIRNKRTIDHYRTKVKIYETEKKANDYEILYNHTKSVSKIGRDIIAAEKLDDVLYSLYSHIDGIMNFNSLALAVVDDESIIYNWVMENNKRMDTFVVDVKNKNSFSSWVVRNKKAIRLNDALTTSELKKYKEDADVAFYGEIMGSMILSPIIYDNKVYGIINVQSHASNVYSEYDLEVINMLSAFIAIAMKNWQNTALLREANEKLEHLSKTDALTGISNRHFLSEIVENLFKYNDSTETISVIMIDIDHFKEYNDTYGHIDGDRCLIKIVDVLSSYLNENGSQLFRYGGDEFAAIIPKLNHEEVYDLLMKTRAQVEDLKIPNKNSSVSDYVTCTFGFTTVTKGEVGYQRVFYVADEALYAAKANGKNQIIYKPHTND